MRLGSEDKRLPGNHHEVVCHRRIHQYSPHAGEILEEPLVAESLLRLMVQGRLYQNMLYMPGREKELVLVFFSLRGLLNAWRMWPSWPWCPALRSSLSWPRR
jgi:hypothetical protein